MAQATKRVYRRVRFGRRRRRRTVLMALMLLLMLGLIIWSIAARGGFTAQPMATPTPTPTASSFERAADAREIHLPETVWYAIQTGVFSSLEAAEDKADDYAHRGAPGVVVEDGGKYRVFIACYGAEDDAAAVRTRLGEQQRVETYLYQWKRDGLHLRISGMAGQLDAAQAGLELMLQTPAFLREAAVLLDAGELTPAEAAQEIRDADSRIRLWQEEADRRFGSSPPDMIARLLKMAASWSNCRDTLLSLSNDATALSAALKTHAMTFYDETRRFCQSFGGI